MKRKVVKQGPATYMVSLPSKWVKKQGIERGDEVEVEEDANTLKLLKNKNHQPRKRVILDIKNFNKIILDRHFAEFYRQGIDEIELRFDNPRFSDYKYGTDIDIAKHVKKLIERFIGLEIVSNTKNRIVIQSFMTNEKSEKIEIVQKRMFYLIKEFMEELVKAMDLDFKVFHEKTYDYHDNIVKFVYYYLRLLRLSDMPDDKKDRLLSLMMVVDKVIDKVRHTSERVREMKWITPKIKEYVNMNFQFFIDQFDMILKEKYSSSDMHEIVKRRYKIINMIKEDSFNDEEIRVIGECKLITDTTNDFLECFTALRIEEYVSESD
ncbi:MAG: AbrB/MazE/SpoVT family DNA-binding domain-containing protein [Candidatus Woesearchaeota archaeon]